MSIQDDLITIIDLANECACLIKWDWNDPRTEVRAIWDLHDMAHVLTGGERVRKDWTNLAATLLGEDDEDGYSSAWPDVKRRGIELLERLERGTTGGEG